MKLSEVKQLNRRLEIAADGHRGVLHLDNFHNPYVKFVEPLEWPSINVGKIGFDQAEKIVELLTRLVPEFVAGCSVLPESRPRKDSNELHLARHHVVDGSDYIYIFKTHAEYLGGARDDEILERPGQGFSPSFKTDRIYFTARLIPVLSVEKEDGHVVDFRAEKIRDAIIRTAEMDRESKPKFAAAMFDEVDFAEVDAYFTSLFSLGGTWKPGKLFHPVLVDYLTLCVNLIVPRVSLVEKLVEPFHQGFRAFLKDGNLDSLEGGARGFWSEYYAAWSYEMALSRSGNPHWKFTGLP